MNQPLQNVQSIRWRDDTLQLLDQRLLPHEEVFLNFSACSEVAEAIKNMVVRGAPAIGIAAAYAVVLAAQNHYGNEGWKEAILREVHALRESRPTAVNLSWALSRMQKRLDGTGEQPVIELLDEAQAIHEEDVTANLHIGEAGAKLILEGSRVLTHCNAGALATGGYGTALGVIRSAWKEAKLQTVYADETRPWLQGARLTAWELQREGIPVTLICEGAAASLMQQGMVDWVIVGADRIVANGDVANKIGTYGLAVLARQHGVKFMVAAPTSTIDMTTPRGSDIPIEYRAAAELTVVGSSSVGPQDVAVWNPVFDITPAELIDYVVTENTTLEAPDKERMRAAFR